MRANEYNCAFLTFLSDFPSMVCIYTYLDGAKIFHDDMVAIRSLSSINSFHSIIELRIPPQLMT